jgi:hypothetical protein
LPIPDGSVWSAQRTALPDRRGERIALFRSGGAASFAEVIAGWRDDADFRAFFAGELAATEEPAFFWEMPPIRRGHTGRAYEYVAIRGDSLAHMAPDAEAFAAKFRDDPRSVVTFRNLGGDALLVAPRPLGDHRSYAHIAAFLRNAPAVQQQELFRVLGLAIDDEMQRSPEPIWVSTSGLGVAWLHVRLDSYPKYYQYRPYATAKWEPVPVR